MGSFRNPRAFLEKVRGSLLFAPGLAVVVAVLAALVLTQPRFELEDSAIPFFAGGASSAQGLLQAITTAVITVTTLTFSLTVITLQLASSQYSPRLLRGFLRDLGTQAVLSVLLATATYSLVVLRSIRAQDDKTGEFVPELAVSVAVVLALLSIGALVYFLDHVTTEIRVDTMLARVRRSTATVIERAYPASPDGVEATAAPTPPHRAQALLALRTGFLQDVDSAGIAAFASQNGVCLLLRPRVGDSLIESTPAAWVWPPEGAADAPEVEKLERLLDRHLTVGFERTAAQDMAFGFRQLTDVASRALSPGVNDPTTAVHATVQLTHLLCMLAQRPMGDCARSGTETDGYSYFPHHTFSDVLEDSVGPLRWYGSEHLEVARATFGLLAEVHDVCSTRPRQVLVEHQARLLMDACGSAHADEDLRALERHAESLLKT